MFPNPRAPRLARLVGTAIWLLVLITCCPPARAASWRFCAGFGVRGVAGVARAEDAKNACWGGAAGAASWGWNCWAGAGVVGGGPGTWTKLLGPVCK